MEANDILFDKINYQETFFIFHNFFINWERFWNASALFLEQLLRIMNNTRRRKTA